jgi:hypothetical protein
VVLKYAHHNNGKWDIYWRGGNGHLVMTTV